MTESVNLASVREKLYERLKPSGWSELLKTFILSSEFDAILVQLLKEAESGKRFTPVIKQLFRAFEECPYKDLKVVIIGQDPYPYGPSKAGGLPVADGIPFSCSNDGKIQASLRYMFAEIKRTVYPKGAHAVPGGVVYVEDPDLARWSRQGVLIVNTAFTTTIGEVGKHYQLWQPFMAFLMDMLCFHNPGLVYVFMGKKAEAWGKSIPDNNWKIACTHPAFAAHTKSEIWNSGDVFNKVNDILWKQNGFKIEW